MQLLCPACHAPLAMPSGQALVACTACAVEVDLSRLGTVAGKPRFVPERDRTGTIVGDYRLEVRLGAGGMGQVYRGVREGPSPGGGWRPAASRVAVKFLAAGLAGDTELRERFQREVKVLAALDHPSVVRVESSGEEDGVPWFAMTLIEGPSLRARLASGPLAPVEARAVFGAVLAALGHAHARGVVHRDLKPANVLLAPTGAVLADFGIARPGEALVSAVTRLTETAAVMGTVPYMSPEQRAGEQLDRRSDLFSVGVMLYEALTGVLPQGAFAPPSRLRPALPAKLDAVVMRLLQPRPEDRFATAALAAQALDRALTPTLPRRTRIAVTAGAALATAVLGLGVIEGPGKGPVISKQTAVVETVAPPISKQAAPVEILEQQQQAAPPAADNAPEPGSQLMGLTKLPSSRKNALEQKGTANKGDATKRAGPRQAKKSKKSPSPKSTSYLDKK